MILLTPAFQLKQHRLLLLAETRGTSIDVYSTMTVIIHVVFHRCMNALLQEGAGMHSSVQSNYVPIRYRSLFIGYV